MNGERSIGLELRDGHDVGRDPRNMTPDELMLLGHVRMSAQQALRLRCIDCSGTSAAEVRLCTHVQCPAWPFRMGIWRKEPERDGGSGRYPRTCRRRCRRSPRRSCARGGGPAMPPGTFLDQAAHVLRERQATYGDPRQSMAAIAARWSITLGHPVTPAQVVLCMIDLNLAPLAHDPRHLDSLRDVAGYAAVLCEVSR